MPLPRYHRLPPERRSSIIAVAREHIARDGENASYNRIITDAGISKTTAYLYFDGKADLLEEVYGDLGRRVTEVAGKWAPVSDEESFWAQLHQTSDALHQHFVSHPEDVALLVHTSPPKGIFDDWLEAMLNDGRSLGLIRSDVPPALMLAATRAQFEVLDQYVLEGLLTGAPVDPNPAWALLKGLWRI